MFLGMLNGMLTSLRHKIYNVQTHCNIKAYNVGIHLGFIVYGSELFNCIFTIPTEKTNVKNTDTKYYIPI